VTSARLLPGDLADDASRALLLWANRKFGRMHMCAWLQKAGLRAGAGARTQCEPAGGDGEQTDGERRVAAEHKGAAASFFFSARVCPVGQTFPQPSGMPAGCTVSCAFRRQAEARTARGSLATRRAHSTADREQPSSLSVPRRVRLSSPHPLSSPFPPFLSRSAQGPMKLMAEGYAKHGEVFTVPVLHKCVLSLKAGCRGCACPFLCRASQATPHHLP
jgi:hypothetical protein